MSARARCAAALLGLAFAVSGCGAEEEAAVIARPPVSVARVETRELVERILVTGELIAANEADVAAEVDGRVTAILVDEGSTVEKGETVIEIDTERRQLELQDARAQLEEAQAHLDQEERETKRWRRLHDSNTASQAQRDTAEANLRLARSRVAAARARLGLAERALRNASVAAPFSGIIAQRHTSQGEFVTTGMDLFTLVSFDAVEVEFRVTERDSGRIEIGQTLDIRVAPFPGEVFAARVSMISPRIDPRSRTLRIKAQVEDPDGRLRPGLFARADLGISQRAAVPMIPESAMLQRSDGSIAFRMQGPDRVERVIVTTGTIRDGHVEIVEGLSEGDIIVVRGHAKLIDGSHVDVRSHLGAPAVAGDGVGARQ